MENIHPNRNERLLRLIREYCEGPPMEGTRHTLKIHAERRVRLYAEIERIITPSKENEDDLLSKLEKYEISLLPDFGNRDIIIKTVKEMKIATTGKTRPSGFIGCCVPVILDIVCSEEDRKKLKDKLDEVATASCDIIKRCPTCGYIH